MSFEMAFGDNASKRPWTRDLPHKQPYFTFSDATHTWEHGTTAHTGSDLSESAHSGRFSVLTWNIDFNLPAAEQRMLAALRQVEQIVTNSSVPCIIFFQEMISSDLKTIQAQPWVRSNYNLSDVSSEYWESNYYGTCTLVPRLFGTPSVFRVHFSNTSMERDALFVDFDIGHGESRKLIRFCNTHLESFVADPPKRPGQLATAASHMHHESVHASVLGGDLNAIEDFDRRIPEANRLQDAYVVSGGLENDIDGCTWGHMARTATREQFGLGRLDKLLFCGKVRLLAFELFGMGVEVTDARDRELLIKEGLEAGWITDHLGLKADFVLTD